MQLSRRLSIGRCLLAALAGLLLPALVLGAELAPPPLKLNPELSDTKRPARDRAKSYKGWIIDALVHMDPGGFREERLPEVLEPARVSGALVMPVPNEGLGRMADGTQQKMRLAQALPGVSKVMCGGDYLSNMLADAQAFGIVESTLRDRLARLERDLDSGLCLGVGELGLLHFNKLGNQNIIEIRPDFPPLLQVVDAVGHRGLWIQLHVEPREPSGKLHYAELEQVLTLWTQRQPRLKLVLSHTAMTSAPNARQILRAYPQVYLSIKLMSTKVPSWRHLEPLLNDEGALYEDWAQLMEEMPDRFVVGSDIKFAQGGRHEGEEDYPKAVQRFRRMLGSLESQTARKIAQGNARRLFGFPPRQQGSDDSRDETER